MKFLALEREVTGVTEDRYAPHLAAEAARAWTSVSAAVG